MILRYRKKEENCVLHIKCRLLPVVVVVYPSSSSNGTICIPYKIEHVIDEVSYVRALEI